MEKRYAPRGLKTAGKKLWSELTDGTFEFNAAEYRILEDTCRQADLIEEINDELQSELKNGRAIVKGSQGQPTANPLIAEIRQHRITLKTLITALKLPEDDAGADPSSAGANLAMHRYRKNG